MGRRRGGWGRGGRGVNRGGWGGGGGKHQHGGMLYQTYHGGKPAVLFRLVFQFKQILGVGFFAATVREEVFLCRISMHTCHIANKQHMEDVVLAINNVMRML